jgi:hypothetical protein
MWYQPTVRKTLLGLAFSIPTLLTGAEKNRDWQMGQVVESKAQADPRIHAIAAATRTYVVRGSIEEGLAVGTTVRFAVQGTTMFLSIAGNEYKLSVLGATVRSAPPTPLAAPSPAAPAAIPAPVITSAPKADNPPVKASEPPLDNDAVVKMIVGGLKEDTVLSVIEARPGKYALAPDALAALRAAGVPQRVIAAMSAKMGAPR